MTYDALLVLSFGGPEKPEDVIPFLDSVLHGRNVPEGRKLEVAEHYYHFAGVSPLNGQNRALVAALERDFAENGIDLPVYWGNRNWRPFLSDTLSEMRADGVRGALAFVTSAYSSYSGCRQYREDVARAQAQIGEGAPEVAKLRVFYNHPGFIKPTAERVRDALEQIPAERRADARLVYTAHSIPLAMADTSNYVEQLREACRLVSDLVGKAGELVYQSRSGPPGQPWLEPDILDVLRRIATETSSPGGKTERSQVVLAPIGFISDHMEVIYDLDTEARELANRLGLELVRAATVGTHPRFIRMIRELVLERLDERVERLALGTLGLGNDVCPPDCCPAPPADEGRGNHGENTARFLDGERLDWRPPAVPKS